ncbi:MAG: hypothetical protein CMJ65_00310 [Planctomycetaceae bacterium]|nr:hypothetical protein [Planctomycetaceae bacterium]
MHVLGKVLAWFAVIGAGAAVALGARTFQVRTAWQKELKTQKEVYAEKAQELRRVKIEREAAVVELANLKRGWGMVWEDVDVRTQRNGDTSEWLLLTNDQQTPGIAGLAAASNQQVPLSIHAFKKTADGKDSAFIGSFVQTGVQNGARGWKATWRVRQSDVAEAWDGGKWRLRTMIPSYQKSRFMNLEVLLTGADQAEKDNEYNSGIKTEISSGADLQLEMRIAELTGNKRTRPENSPPLPVHMIEGLVRVIADAEEGRNQAVEVVDQLRRDLKSAHDRANLLLRQNSDLGRSLPGSAVTTKVTRK